MRPVLAFVGPGKTGTSSIFDALKSSNYFQLVSIDTKECYIHSHDFIKDTSYRKYVWSQKVHAKLSEQYLRLLSEHTSKPLILLEPSYLECDSALQQLADFNTVFILTYRTVLDRIVSHICMDISLGILPHHANSSFVSRLDERIYYYLHLSDLHTSIRRIQYILTTPCNLIL